MAEAGLRRSAVSADRSKKPAPRESGGLNYSFQFGPPNRTALGSGFSELAKFTNARNSLAGRAGARGAGGVLRRAASSNWAFSCSVSRAIDRLQFRQLGLEMEQPQVVLHQFPVESDALLAG